MPAAQMVWLRAKLPASSPVEPLGWFLFTCKPCPFPSENRGGRTEAIYVCVYVYIYIYIYIYMCGGLQPKGIRQNIISGLVA